MSRMKILETSVIKYKDKDIKNMSESVMPEVIYPEIRAITANKVTRNNTFYPSESLRGDPVAGTGVYSLLYPYPVPLIRDHATGGGMFSSESSPIYGRIRKAEFVEGAHESYISAIAEVSHKEAIEHILSDRFLTVSIGVFVDSVKCSICGVDMAESMCDHQRGKTYLVDGKSKKAYWIMGPVVFEELSFVIVPSDDQARVINKNTAVESEFFEYAPKKNTIWQIGKPSKNSLGVLVDEKYGITYNLPEITKDNVYDMFESIKESSLLEADKNRLFAKIGRFCEEQKIDLPNKVGEFNQIEDAIIPINEKTYPLLHYVIDGYKQAMEIKMNDEIEKGLELESGEGEENPQGAVNQEVGDDSSEQIKVLESQCLKLQAELHVNLAKQAAIIYKVLGRKVAENKSLNDLTNELAKRSTQSLEHLLSDLYADLEDFKPTVKEIERPKNPVIQDVEHTIPEVTTTAGSLGKVGNIQEVEEDSLYLFYGVDQKKLQEINQMVQNSFKV